MTNTQLTFEMFYCKQHFVLRRKQFYLAIKSIRLGEMQHEMNIEYDFLIRKKARRNIVVTYVL